MHISRVRAIETSIIYCVPTGIQTDGFQMKLRSIKVFCDVVSRRSFSEAARDNQITQSATSQIIQHLEERLGTKLLDRSTRPFLITEAGQTYYEGCSRILEQYEDLETKVSGLANVANATIRVASIYSVGLSYMRQFVQRFNESNPDIHVQLEYHHPQRVYDLIKSGESDIGLLSYAAPTRSISAIAWRAEPMVVVLGNEHPLADCDEVSLQSLHGLEMVAFNQDLRIRQEIQAVFSDCNIVPRVVMEFDNIETLKRAIEINTGFSILPKAHIERELISGSLCCVNISGPPLIRPVGIIHRNQVPLGTNIENFIEMLIEDERIFPKGERHPELLENQTNHRFSVPDEPAPAMATRQ